MDLWNEFIMGFWETVWRVSDDLFTGNHSYIPLLKRRSFDYSSLLSCYLSLDLIQGSFNSQKEDFINLLNVKVLLQDNKKFNTIKSDQLLAQLYVIISSQQYLSFQETICYFVEV